MKVPLVKCLQFFKKNEQTNNNNNNNNNKKDETCGWGFKHLCTVEFCDFFLVNVFICTCYQGYIFHQTFLFLESGWKAQYERTKDHCIHGNGCKQIKTCRSK